MNLAADMHFDRFIKDISFFTMFYHKRCTLFSYRHSYFKRGLESVLPLSLMLSTRIELKPHFFSKVIRLWTLQVMFDFRKVSLSTVLLMILNLAHFFFPFQISKRVFSTS
jgi:hypothetical protein